MERITDVFRFLAWSARLMLGSAWIAAKWAVRGVRSKWAVEDIKLETGHEIEEYISKLNRRLYP